MNGLDDLERAAERRRRKAPPPRHPRNLNARAETSPERSSQGEGAAGQQVDVAASAVALTSTTLAQALPKIAQALPKPHAPRSREAALVAEERAELAQCEQLLRVADLAFWVKGRVLATIKEAALYREGYDSFDAYCLHEWDMTARRAYQLMDAWELAERIAMALADEGFRHNLNEGQVRALLGYARRHGNDAALLVYQVVCSSGRRVTGALLKAVVERLPNDEFDPDKVTALIKEYLADEGATPIAPPEEERDVFVAVQSAVRRITSLATDKDTAARIADELERTAARLREQYM